MVRRRFVRAVLPAVAAVFASGALAATVFEARAAAQAAPARSVARLWNEQLLGAIRVDIPKPPVHARNLFHLSVAMWDAWAAYTPGARGYLVTEKRSAPDVEAARRESISFAAYRLLKFRFPAGFSDADGRPCHPNAPASQAAFDAQMDALGYDRTFTSTIGDSPAAFGNRIAATVVFYGQTDGANEGAGRCYPDDTGYVPVNPPLVFKLPGAGDLVSASRWQPLAFDFLITQNGIIIGSSIQRFIGVGWADVRPFALTEEDLDPGSGLYLDPGEPPRLGAPSQFALKAAVAENLLRSTQVDPAQGVLIDISPGAPGFASVVGRDDGPGHPLNPTTGRPYPTNLVDRADWTRVVAEFWADGPRSETPPGHWNVIANGVADALPADAKRIGGAGPVLGDLEWDVKTYLALNGAVHDAAIWCWGAKHRYDSSRPITLVRAMGGRGQSSRPRGPSYHPDGLPLVPGVVEVITPETTGPGERHAHLRGYEGLVAVRSWRGSPASPREQVSGVGWILAIDWMPYQASTFVTPPFPGYPSGHSTFSRSAAEVLAAMTGSEYFPGGLGTFVAPAHQYLSFELGPTRTVTLQWATYFDAADQAGLSRRLGGIHPYTDDYPARRAGAAIGKRAWTRARAFFDQP